MLFSKHDECTCLADASDNSADIVVLHDMNFFSCPIIPMSQKPEITILLCIYSVCMCVNIRGRPRLAGMII